MESYYALSMTANYNVKPSIKAATKLKLPPLSTDNFSLPKLKYVDEINLCYSNQRTLVEDV